MNPSCTPTLNVSDSLSPANASANSFSVAVEKEVNNMIVTTFWLGALVPISIALIFTSSHLWKKPVFVLNMCAIACAVAFGAVALMNEVSGLADTQPSQAHPPQKDIIAGRPGSMRRLQALFLLSYLIPICTQSILLLRILAVYPPRLLPWKKNLLIYGVLAVVLAARIINIALYLHQVIVTLNRSGDRFSAWKSPFLRVDWFLQLFYVV